MTNSVGADIVVPLYLTILPSGFSRRLYITCTILLMYGTI